MKPVKRKANTSPVRTSHRQATHNAYFDSLAARMRAAVYADNDWYTMNRNAGPFKKVEMRYSPHMRRLILKDIETKENERRKGHFKRLVALMNDLAQETGLKATEIQSILSPHIRHMLPWKGFPAVAYSGNSSVKRYKENSYPFNF